jgi:hypothetical protein
MQTNRTLMLLVVLIGLALSQTAQAFYNPSAGRWLNRDPIEEKGGLNVYGFVDNSPIGRLDPYGQDPWGGNKLFFWLFGRCICNQSLFNPRTHCCIDGEVLPRKPIETGVVTHTWHQNPNGPGKYHVWLTWDGGSADSNGDSVIFEPGNRRISSPALSMPSPSEDKTLLLSPCKYDFKKLNACLSTKGATEKGKPGGLCSELPPKWISECMKESER